MPAWRDRTPGERASLALAVQSMSAERADPAPTPAQLATGRAVFAQHCTQCHGEAGDGAGFAGEAVAMAPASFIAQRPTLAEAMRALRDGVPGSPMAPWTPRLGDDDLLAVAHYVRSLYRGSTGGATP
jgi:mono/diheme cytochrome c family protein